MKNNVWLWTAVAIASFAVPAAAADPELRYVVILGRHGVRAPTWDAARLNASSAEPWPEWHVPPANLTPHGRELITLLGAYYRARFTADHLLASQGCADASRIRVQADADQRTQETGRAFAESIAPGCGVSVQTDTLFAGQASPELDAAVQAARVRAESSALLQEHRAAADALSRVLKKPIESLATGSTLSENLLLEYANGMSASEMGWGRLTKENLFEALELHRVYAEVTRRTPGVARLRGAKLMTTILESLEQAVAGAPGAILFLSGHDTNQSNVSGMLGMNWTLPGYQPDDTPPGGAILFSLWRDPSTSKFFVRTEYLAQTLDQMHDASPLSLQHPPASQAVTIRGCAASKNGCAWETFHAAVEKSLALPAN